MTVIRNGVEYERIRGGDGRFLPMNLPSPLPACPWCGEQLETQYSGGRKRFGTLDALNLWQVICPGCGHAGPAVESEFLACEEWLSIMKDRRYDG